MGGASSPMIVVPFEVRRTYPKKFSTWPIASKNIKNSIVAFNAGWGVVNGHECILSGVLSNCPIEEILAGEGGKTTSLDGREF